MSHSHEVGGPNALLAHSHARRLSIMRDTVTVVLMSYVVGGLSAHDALKEISHLVSKDTGEDVLNRRGEDAESS